MFCSVVYFQRLLLALDSNQFSLVFWPTVIEHGVAFWPEEDTWGDSKAEPTCTTQSNAGPWERTPSHGTAGDEADSRYQKDGQTGTAGTGTAVSLLQPGWLLVCHHTPTSLLMINDLYWLPILVPIRCKVLILVGKSQKGLAPKYLCELMCKPFSAGSSRPLHSADWFELLVPRWCTSLSQHLTFAVVGPSGPSLWNESNDTPPGTCSLE